MGRKRSRRRGDLEQRHRQFLLLGLSAAARPLTLHDFRHQLQRMGYHFGMSHFLVEHDQSHLSDEELQGDLDYLQDRGLVRQMDNERYELTEAGQAEATRRDSEMSRLRSKLARVVSDSALASVVSMLVNAALAAIKLGAGLLFSSVALVADGMDSTLDVLSAAGVYFGIKHNREALSSAFIIALMYITGGAVGYQSIGKILRGEPVDATILAFLAAAISGAVCYLMSVYQHMVGKRTASLSLLSQSIDSRNHVVQAIAVIAGLVLARAGIYVADAIVGLIVSVLIARSAIGLTAELLRARRDGDLDTSRFEREYERLWSARHRRYFESWLLMLLEVTHTRDEILSHYEDVFRAEDLPIVRHFSPARTYDLPANLDSMLADLEQRRLISRTPAGYRTTTEGNDRLRRGLKRWSIITR